MTGTHYSMHRLKMHQSTPLVVPDAALGAQRKVALQLRIRRSSWNRFFSRQRSCASNEQRTATVHYVALRWNRIPCSLPALRLTHCECGMNEPSQYGSLTESHCVWCKDFHTPDSNNDLRPPFELIGIRRCLRTTHEMLREVPEGGRQDDARRPGRVAPSPIPPARSPTLPHGIVLRAGLVCHDVPRSRQALRFRERRSLF